jgi:hypothetical protein
MALVGLYRLTMAPHSSEELFFSMADFSADIMYLVSRGIDVSNIKTAAYARRLASATKRAETAGKAAPTRSELRGHARAPIELLPKKGHQLEQHSMVKPQNMADLAHLTRRAKKKKRWLLVVSGRVSKYPHMTIGEFGIPKTISRWVSAASLKTFAKEHKEGDLDDFLAWANTLLEGVEWVEVDTLSIAYPAEKEQ